MRYAIAIAEVIVCVLEGRGGFEVERREHVHARELCRVLLVLLDAAPLAPRTFWNFAGEFSSFRRQGATTEDALISDMVRPVYSGDCAICLSRAVASRRTGPRVPASVVDHHAAASINEHVPQAPDRLASSAGAPCVGRACR